jgi:hypothetical protein
MSGIESTGPSTLSAAIHGGARAQAQISTVSDDTDVFSTEGGNKWPSSIGVSKMLLSPTENTSYSDSKYLKQVGVEFSLRVTEGLADVLQIGW